MEKLKAVLSLITRDNDYQLEQATAAEAVARQHNVDLEVVYANSDSVVQSSQLVELIYKHKSKLNAILVEPAGGTDFPQVAKAAFTAGIAWVLLNRDDSSLADLRRNSAVPIFAVSSDHEELGRIQARQLAAILPSGATVVCIQGPSASLVAQQRLVGLEAAKPPNITLRMLKSADWTEEGGFHAVASWLRLTTAKATPIGAVAAQNDFIAIGARKSFEQVKSELPEPFFLGIDGLPRTGQALVDRGQLAATVVVPPIAGTALEMLVTAIAQKSAPPPLQLISGRSYPAIEKLRSDHAGTYS